MTIGSGSRKRTLHVEGERWEEVRDVATALAHELEGKEAARSPWATGSFYLLAVLLLIALLLVVGKTLSVWVLPVIIVGGLLLVTVIGALQLRHDAKLGEKNFIVLMGLVFKQLPLIGKFSGKPVEEKGDIEKPPAAPAAG